MIFLQLAYTIAAKLPQIRLTCQPLLGRDFRSDSSERRIKGSRRLDRAPIAAQLSVYFPKDGAGISARPDAPIAEPTRVTTGLPRREGGSEPLCECEPEERKSAWPQTPANHCCRRCCKTRRQADISGLRDGRAKNGSAVAREPAIGAPPGNPSNSLRGSAFQPAVAAAKRPAVSLLPQRKRAGQADHGAHLRRSGALPHRLVFASTSIARATWFNAIRAHLPADDRNRRGGS